MNVISHEIQLRFNENAVAYFVKDVNGIYKTINEAGAQLLDQSPIEVAGRADFDFFSRPSAELILHRDAEILSVDRVREIHSVVKTNARWMRFISLKQTLRNRIGNKVGLVCLSTEIADAQSYLRVEMMRESFAQIADVTSQNLTYFNEQRADCGSFAQR